MSFCTRWMSAALQVLYIKRDYLKLCTVRESSGGTDGSTCGSRQCDSTVDNCPHQSSTVCTSIALRDCTKGCDGQERPNRQSNTVLKSATQQYDGYAIDLFGNCLHVHIDLCTPLPHFRGRCLVCPVPHARTLTEGAESNNLSYNLSFWRGNTCTVQRRTTSKGQQRQPNAEAGSGLVGPAFSFRCFPQG